MELLQALRAGIWPDVPGPAAAPPYSVTHQRAAYGATSKADGVANLQIVQSVERRDKQEWTEAPVSRHVPDSRNSMKEVCLLERESRRS